MPLRYMGVTVGAGLRHAPGTVQVAAVAADRVKAMTREETR